jgi:hypothetical protein
MSDDLSDGAARSGPEFDESDKPRTDAEIRALTDRQSGFPYSGGFGPDRCGQWGTGIHGQINQAVFGDGTPATEPPMPADFKPVSQYGSKAAWSTVSARERARRLASILGAGAIPPAVKPQYLQPRHVRRLYNAVWAANALGYHLNVWGTGSWYLEYGTDQAAGVRACTKFLKTYGQWLADHDYNHVAYAFVHENPGSTKFHTHFLLHVPMNLNKAFTDWAGNYARKSFNYRSDTDPLLQLKIRDPHDIHGQLKRLSYMCKGYDPDGILFRVNDAPVRLGDVICDRHADPGPMNGQKYGISRALHERQYQPDFRANGLPPLVSPLEAQIHAKILDGEALYPRVPPPTYFTPPQLRPSSAKRKRDCARQLLEALTKRELDRELGML